MDDRMQGFLDRTKAAASAIGTVAGATVRYAGKRSGEAIGTARLSLKTAELERQTQNILRDIGQAVYEAIQTGESREELLDARTEELEHLYAAISGLKDQAAVLRDAKKCPACGTVCAHEDRYCKHCGAVL